MHRLLIRPGALGDCVLALPALECLRAAHTAVWLPRGRVPLIRFADEVRALADTGLDQLGLPGVEPPLGLLRELGRFDHIVSWYGSNRPDFREALEGLGGPVTFFPALPNPEGSVHAADFFGQQASALVPCSLPCVPRLPFKVPRGDYAVIHPFSGSVRKNWPLAGFQQVARVLSEHMPVQWSRGPEEDLPGSVLIEDAYELAGWLAGARLYLGNDSGVTHLAAAAGAPTLALFGQTRPEVWAPRGSNVTVLTTAQPGSPMSQLSLDEVSDAAMMLLHR